MPDVPLVNRASISAPKDYTLPQAQSIVLRAVQAEIDGTSAAGTFLPVVQLISDAGDVMWTALDRNTTIAAGGTATVTWFPNVKPEASSSGGGGALSWAYISGSTPTTVNAGTTKKLTATAGNFYTNAPTIFDTATNNTISGIRMLANGHYLVLSTAAPNATPAAGSLYDLVTVGGGVAAAFEMAPSAVSFPTGGVTDVGRVTAGEIHSVGGFVTPPTPALITEIINSGASNVTFDMNGTLIVQLDTVNQDLN